MFKAHQGECKDYYDIVSSAFGVRGSGVISGLRG